MKPRYLRLSMGLIAAGLWLGTQVAQAESKPRSVQPPVSTAKAGDGRFVWDVSVAPKTVSEHTWRHDGWVTAVVFSPDGRRVLTGSDDKTVVLRDAQSGKTLHTWQHDGRVSAASFSPDGRRVLTGSRDKTAVLRDAQSGKTLHTWQHDYLVNAVAYSPDGQRVLTVSWDETVVLRDVQSGATLHTWRHHWGVTASVAFSPDGRRVLTDSVDNTAVLRDAQSGAALHTWQHTAQITAVAFSPDGQRVLTGSRDKTAVLRNAQSGATLHTWRHDGWVTAVVFSPDGQRVLIGFGGTVVLRDAQSGADLHTWQHKNVVTAVAFSPDGQRVLTGSGDNAAVLRDAKSGNTLHTWRCDGPVSAVAFSPDGQRVLISTGRTVVQRQTPLSINDLFGIALAAAEQGWQSLPQELADRQAALKAQSPAAKDEFETHAKYQSRVQQWNAAVEALNQSIQKHYARLGPLPLAERARAMQKAVAESYGKPFLTDIRYDAESARFFATLKADLDPSLKRQLVIEVPNDKARAAKAALEESAGLEIQMRVDDQNTLFWEGATIALSGQRHLVHFTDTNFAAPSIAPSTQPTLAAFTPPVLATLPIGPKVNISDDPRLAKLQREVLEREQAQALQAAREAEEKRLRERLAALQAATSERFEDDLPALLARQSATPPDPHLHVLVIGINDYAEVPDVPYADRSALFFADLAQKRWGAEKHNVLLLTNADATNGRLRGRIKTLLNRLGPKDRLLVYYAGHGVPAKDGKSAYLLAQDGGPGSYEEADLQLDSLYASIEKSRVGRASVFIDACFSGRSGKDSIVFEGVGGITLVPRQGVKPDGRLSVITAGRNDQFSNQDKAHGHRLFGYHLMKALLEGDGKQSISQLHATISQRVVTDSRRIGPEFEQEPELLGNGKIKIH